MGARGIYLYSGGKDTLYRIHGTNQPEWIGHAISSGCIRMTNEDVIDLYNHVKMGTIVVVLGPRSGNSPVNHSRDGRPTLQLLRTRGGWERRRAAARRRFICLARSGRVTFA